MKYHIVSAGELAPENWNAAAATLPGAHVLQTWEWGQVKGRFGWQPFTWVWRNQSGQVVAAALVLQRSLSFPRVPVQARVLYVPKGPLLDWKDAPVRQRVLEDLGQLARQQGAIFIKIDADVCLGKGVPDDPGAQVDPTGQVVVDEMQACGWHFSDEQIQFRNTVWIDLQPDEKTLLANMKQKTRYNIRLAERKGVSVRLGDEPDLGELYRMYAQTSLRDGFVIREQAYYEYLWSTFIQSGMAQPLIAEVDGEMIAAVILFRFARKVWYLYGMSSQSHREKMPNYLLQWEAMRWAKMQGCRVYDLWGAPDKFDESDSLWGVYRFKRGLGGQVVRTIGAWDLPVRPGLYWLYSRLLPRLMGLMRWRATGRMSRTFG